MLSQFDGEKNQQPTTFDLTRVQFAGQTESGKRSGEAAMWNGDAVTVVSRFGTEGVRIFATGTSAAFLFDFSATLERLSFCGTPMPEQPALISSGQFRHRAYHANQAANCTYGRKNCLNVDNIWNVCLAKNAY